MRRILNWLLIIIFTLCRISGTYAQYASNIIKKNIPVSSGSIRIDTLSIVPNSVLISGIDSSAYMIDYFNHTLYWKNKPDTDSVHISYRVFSNDFSAPYFHKDVKKIEQNFIINPYIYDANELDNNKGFVDFGNLNYNGSFGRALSFGNNQDVILNSQFNLQLEGELGDSIFLTGAITDNTIPFQPEGNTQQIQEFDKIFIQLSKKQAKLIAGDFDIKKPNGYFMQFYKRVQGGFVSNTFTTGKQGWNKISAGASLAKGKFVRNPITPIEGNQGPYKLIGPNGEQYFIVLAGTERVYIDGVLLQRGEELDYVIDYNAAEITFMPRKMITKDLRIVVEFEFSDRNYVNSFLFVNNEWQVNAKLQMRFNLYANQDAKNQPIIQSLDSSQKRFLASIGDSIQMALYPSVKKLDSFSTNTILYQQKDTVVNGIAYLYYAFSTNPDSARYSLGFTYVGANKGYYKQSVNSANGRVYQWVAPMMGILQGDYAPVTVLVTPKKQHMYTIGTTYQIDSNKQLMAEGALSNYDPNLFSPIHNNAHLGFAGKLIYQEKRKLSSTKPINIQTQINYEYVDQRFKAIERFRNVEFTRDWNITTSNVTANEHITTCNVKLNNGNLWFSEHQWSSYFRGNDFKGNQIYNEFNFQHQGYKFLIKNSAVLQRAATYYSNFLRPTIELEKSFNKTVFATIGAKYFIEHNPVKDIKTDSLLANSFSFNVLHTYIKSNPSKENQFNIQYTRRIDQAKKDNNLQTITIGNTYAAQANINTLKNQNVSFTATYRTLQITDTTITSLKPDENLLGRIEYTFTLARQAIQGSILYELGAGQELKREYTYVEVPAGQGIYVWRDYNNDNLKQLNEFEIAIFTNEKRYIRVFTPTNQYVKAKYAQFNQSLIIQPKMLWSATNRSALKKLASAVYFQTAIQINNRMLGEKGIAQYNPFMQQFNDTTLISSSASYINSFFINRLNPTWGAEIIQTIIAGKTLLNYGIDSRKQTEYMYRVRYNIKKNITCSGTFKSAQKTLGSQFLETRNYNISQKNIEPNLSWQLRANQLRLVGSYRYDVRKNASDLGGEKSISQQINIDIKYNIISSGHINASCTLNRIEYNGLSNSTLGYVMLDGLQAGKNWLWQLSFERRLSKNIEMSIQYEGRKPSGSAVIHTGRAAVRAIF